MAKGRIRDRKPADRLGYHYVYKNGCDGNCNCPWKGNCIGETWPHWIEEEKMAVQFADKALDEWLTIEIEKAVKAYEADPDPCYSSREFALRDTQEYLHKLWGSALK